MAKSFKVGPVTLGGRAPLFLVAGPCVIESESQCLGLARRLARLAARDGIPLIFKASYDKANRSSVQSFRGPGLEAGLAILARVKAETGLPVLTDVHETGQVAAVARVVDVLQVPAFLCRQTDLLLACGDTGLPVNIKKGQFMAPGDMANVIAKVESTGNRRLVLTERGASFGYNNLVADMRSLVTMRGFGYPVVFDVTHSVQRPGGAGDRSAGDAHLAPALARAAVAAGCDGVFIETAIRPEQALSDGANSLRLSALGNLWRTLRGIDEVVS